MRIVNRSRGTLLGTRIQLADTWFSRLRGFLFRPAPRLGEGILLTPCDAIHTWGMSFDLDVLFLDARGDVVAVQESLPPGRVTPRVATSRYVLEIPSGTIAATGTRVGDRCNWSRDHNGAPHNLRPLQGAS
ncbi:MAG: DUF192 domain-containing protein [Longimicrobiales bacterium]|nr:DUF192 domain-containing protein [Longimicrobiales bacterium]